MNKEYTVTRETGETVTFGFENIDTSELDELIEDEDEISLFDLFPDMDLSNCPIQKRKNHRKIRRKARNKTLKKARHRK